MVKTLLLGIKERFLEIYIKDGVPHVREYVCAESKAFPESYVVCACQEYGKAGLNVRRGKAYMVIFGHFSNLMNEGRTMMFIPEEDLKLYTKLKKRLVASSTYKYSEGD